MIFEYIPIEIGSRLAQNFANADYVLETNKKVLSQFEVFVLQVKIRKLFLLWAIPQSQSMSPPALKHIRINFIF